MENVSGVVVCVCLPVLIYRFARTDTDQVLSKCLSNFKLSKRLLELMIRWPRPRGIRIVKQLEDFLVAPLFRAGPGFDQAYQDDAAKMPRTWWAAWCWWAGSTYGFLALSSRAQADKYVSSSRCTTASFKIARQCSGDISV
jgi:hypothetical protein